MTADKAPRRFQPVFKSCEAGTYPSMKAVKSKRGTYVESEEYDALAAERDELKFHWERATKYVMPGTCDTPDSIYQYLNEMADELSREKKKVEKLLGAVVQVNHGDGYYSHHKAIFQYDHPGQSRVVIHAGEQFEAESEVRCE